MNNEEMLEIKKQILHAGALMRQANFCERGIPSDVISFMVESAFNKLIERERISKEIKKPKNDATSQKKTTAQIIEFKQKEN